MHSLDPLHSWHFLTIRRHNAQSLILVKGSDYVFEQVPLAPLCSLAFYLSFSHFDRQSICLRAQVFWHKQVCLIWADQVAIVWLEFFLEGGHGSHWIEEVMNFSYPLAKSRTRRVLMSHWYTLPNFSILYHSVLPPNPILSTTVCIQLLPLSHPSFFFSYWLKRC